MKTLTRSCLVFLASLGAATALVQTDAHAESTPAGTSIADAGGGGSGAGIGVGAAAFLTGITGPEVVYDQQKFHLEGLLGFASVKPGAGANAPTFTTVQFGVRGWYHLHRGINSDFSLGGGLGLITESGGGGSNTTTSIEPGFQARVFLTPNFDLHATGGLSLAFGDNTGGINRGVGLSAQLTGGIGFAYFFR